MFLPRSLRTPARPHHQPRPPPQAPPALPENPTDGQPAEDPAILCALALSDYELWSNPNLRDPNHDGFVPLRTLLHTSSVFLAANVGSVSLTEAAIVKSMRAHAKDTFDIRMIVVDKVRSRRGHHGYALAGGYELRRKDWAEATQRFPAFSPEYWGVLTIYIENIPLLFRSMVGLSKLLHSLLPRDRSLSSTADYRCIQSIYFPPHHQDPPDAIPKCKGFALVTLSESSATSHLLTRFPYHKHANNRRGAPADDVDEASPEELEARKAGFRALSKERWEALQSEYAEYRDALLRHVAASSSAPTQARVSTAPAPAVVLLPSPNPPTPAVASVGRAKYASTSQPAETPPSYYPPGCVIFVRHIPQDTNKTALRARFSAVFADDDPAALDYVDYTKGLDSCYLRLTTREHALLLLKRFEKEQGTGEAVALELLDGRREEMYWECVPDKVRALAVQRAQVHSAQPKNGGRVQAVDEDASVGMGERKRRRRHG